MHWNGDDMYTMRKLGWVSLLAATVAIGGCDDDGDGSNSGVGTSATMGMDTDSTDTETAGETETESESDDGSSSGGDIDCSSPLSHDADIQPIWDANCVAACHESGGSWSVVDLSPGTAYDALIEVQGTISGIAGLDLVVPGDVENSFLQLKIEGTQENAGAGNERMPLGADPLSASDIEAVEAWIACGAEP